MGAPVNPYLPNAQNPMMPPPPGGPPQIMATGPVWTAPPPTDDMLQSAPPAPPPTRLPGGGAPPGVSATEQAIKALGQNAPAPPKDNKWQAIGRAILSMSKFGPAADAILHPQATSQAHAYQQQANELAAQLQLQQEQQGIDTSQAQAKMYQQHGQYWEDKASQEKNRFKLDPKSGMMYDTQTGQIIKAPQSLTAKIKEYADAGYSDEDAKSLAVGGKMSDRFPVTPQMGQDLGLAPDAQGRFFIPGSQIGVIHKADNPADKNPTEASLALDAQNPDPKISGPAKAALGALTQQKIAGRPIIPGGQQSTDAKDIAQAIIDGTQPPTLQGLYRQGSPVRAELARNGYDLMTAQRDWQAVQRHLATLNGQQQERLRQAIQATSDGLDQINDLYDQWKKVGPASGFKMLNRAALAGAKQLPGPTGSIAQNLEAQINDLVSELGTVYKGGNASTDESLRLAAENLKADWNEDTFKRAITQIRRNLQIRRNSILTSQPVGVSPNSPYNPPQQTPPPTQAPASTGSGMVHIRASDGKEWHIPAAQIDAARQRDPKLQVIP